MLTPKMIADLSGVEINTKFLSNPQCLFLAKIKRHNGLGKIFIANEKINSLQDDDFFKVLKMENKGVLLFHKRQNHQLVRKKVPI